MPVDPQCQFLIDTLEALGIPELSALPHVELRAAMEALSAQNAADRPAVADTRDVDADGVAVRVYWPAGSQPGDVRPVLVWYHGGGWVIGSVEGADMTCRSLANRSGAVVVSVGYRLAPEHPFPTPVHDCWTATRWVIEHAASIGGDAARVAIGGDSAGGNLAAVMAIMAREAGIQLRLQLLVYPAVDFSLSHPSVDENGKGYLLSRNDMVWFMAHYGLGRVVDAGDWRVSPIKAPSHAGLAPAYVITAEYDPLRDEGEAYAAALRQAGVVATATRYGGMIHGFFGMLGQVDAATSAHQAAGAALAAALR